MVEVAATFAVDDLSTESVGKRVLLSCKIQPL